MLALGTLFRELSKSFKMFLKNMEQLKLILQLLMPKSMVYDGSDTCVNLMCHSGSIVSIPHDLRIPFARYVGRYGIAHIKRYSIDKVFRERKVHGLHPRELIECAFDIVDSSQGKLYLQFDVKKMSDKIKIRCFDMIPHRKSHFRRGSVVCNV